MHMRNKASLIVLLLAFGAVMGACSAGNQNDAAGSNGAGNKYEARAKQTIPDDQLNRNEKATVERLEQLAKGVPGVQSANCVLFGKTAVVGIDVSGTLDRSRVGTVKYAVAEAMRDDPVGVNAIVTADMDLNNRLKEIRQDLQNGRPMAGFAEELADIVGRIIPQLPRDTNDRTEGPPTPGATTQDQASRRAKHQHSSLSPQPQ